jgi:hypothetical protein
MNRIIFSLAIFFLSIIIISCSEDNPSDSNQTTLLPIKTGNYWIYENYTLDSNNNRIQGNPSIDSTIVTGTITLHDTTGAIFITYNTDSSGTNSGDSAFYHTNKMKVYVYSNYFTSIIGNLPFNINIPISEQWVKLVDSDDEDWKVIEQEIPDTQIFPGVTIKGTATILGTNAGLEIVNAESQNFNTRKFILKMTFTGNIVLFSNTLPINLERKTYLYFADNVGLIKSIVEPMKIELLPGMNMPGHEQILIRHHIAN